MAARVVRKRPLNLLCLLTLLQVSLPSLSVSVSLPAHSTPKRPVYGYIHMAKAAGSNLNAALSTHYERVCGNKGNSYDALQHNHRVNRSDNPRAKKIDDIYYKRAHERDQNRGRIDQIDVLENGIQDCDYISNEGGTAFWVDIAKYLRGYKIPFELHLPCREPMDHLMSQCNHHRISLNCNQSMDLMLRTVDKCVMMMKRFRFSLTSISNLSLRCFASNVTFSRYVPYMGRRLQSRKIQMVHSDRSTNRPRQRAAECIWDNEHAALRKEVAEYLIEKHDYYRYCDACLGSDRDLFINEYIAKNNSS